MPMQSIPIGPSVPLTGSGVAYALPPTRCTLYCDATTPGLQTSNIFNFPSPTTLTVTGGQAIVNGGFIRTIGAGCSIMLKRD